MIHLTNLNLLYFGEYSMNPLMLFCMSSGRLHKGLQINSFGKKRGKRANPYPVDTCFLKEKETRSLRYSRTHK